MATKFDSKTFNPEAFGKYLEIVPRTKRNELLKAGVIKSNANIKEAFSSQTGTAYATVPMFGRIGGEALNYDGKTDVKATSTTTFEQGVVVVGRMKAWEEKDFSEDITGGVDFMSNVGNQVVDYWEDLYQDSMLRILDGVFAMTDAEDKKFVDAHTLDTTAEGDGTLELTSLNTATQKALGDNKAAMKVAIMHSAVATNLENKRFLKNLTITDKDGVTRDIAIYSWNGRVVFVDDSMPVVKGTGAGAKEKYTTYLLGDGAFAYENIGAKVENEMVRDAKTDGGSEMLITRRRFVYAPYGISYIKKSQATLSPTDKELADGKNWKLVNDGEATDKQTIDIKAIPIARIISLG